MQSGGPSNSCFLAKHFSLVVFRLSYVLYILYRHSYLANKLLYYETMLLLIPAQYEVAGFLFFFLWNLLTSLPQATSAFRDVTHTLWSSRETFFFRLHDKHISCSRWLNNVKSIISPNDLLRVVQWKYLRLRRTSDSIQTKTFIFKISQSNRSSAVELSNQNQPLITCFDKF